MTSQTWKLFCNLRQEYWDYVQDLNRTLPDLKHIQQQLIIDRSGPDFTVETPIVYNQALDTINEHDDIKLILVADNPGRREQAAEHRRYLIGPSGKLAEAFFKQHQDLGIDFRKHVIILNKTPIHTPRTGDLKQLSSLGGPMLERTLAESQRWMAHLIYRFHHIFTTIPVWIIGYSEMGKGKLFAAFTEELSHLYQQDSRLKNQVFLYRHFSMNQFSIDFSRQQKPEESTAETLARIGIQYRSRIFNW
ncbi:MAG: hypothetical protein SNJ56_04955 [Termitinemataceae bacterium]